MTYRDNKVYDFRLVKTMTHQALTIDLGKTFSGTITAFMKTDASSDHYREFTVVDGRYLTLTQDQTVDYIDDGVTYPIAGRWYVNVWQLKDGQSEEQIVYTGRILFVESIDDINGDSGGTPPGIGQEIWFFQFDDVTSDINDISQIDSTFLTTNGQQLVESSILEGQNITHTDVGRYGFYIPSTSINPPYTINNQLGDITDSFDYQYQNGNAYYVSQEIAIPSTIYYKLIQT